MLWLIVGIACLTVGLTGMWLRKSKLLQQWRGLSDQLSLRLVPGHLWRYPHLEGRNNMVPLRVEMRSYSSSQGQKNYVFIVAQARPVIEELHICLRPENAENIPSVQTGDLAFDKAIQVQGREEIVLACLGAAGRASAWEVVHTLRGTVVNGAIECPVGPLDTDHERYKRTLESVLELAQSFDLDPDAVPEQLHKNLQTEMDPNVRHTTLDVLLQHFPESKAAQKAAAKAHHDPDSRVQLAGAKHPQEHSSLQQIGNVLLSNASVSVRQDALQHLVNIGPASQILPLLIDRLTDTSSTIQCEAARALGKLGDPRCVDALIRRSDSADASLLRAIADAFGELGTADSQPTLLHMLKHTDSTVQIAAMAALGRVGTATILERLVPYTKGLMAEGPLRQAAIAAVQQVEKRIEEQSADVLTPPKKSENDPMN